MKINTKIVGLIIISLTIISLLLVSTSVFILLNNQKESLDSFKNEFIEEGAELIQKNANLFFITFDQRIQENPSMTHEEIISFMSKIDPRGQDIAVLDFNGNHLFEITKNPAIYSLINQSILNYYLNRMTLNGETEFVLDNYKEFLNDKTNSLVPARMHFKIYEPQRIVAGYGKALETGRIRIIFLQNKNEQYFKTYLIATFAIFLITLAGALFFTIKAMKKLVINPLEKVTFALQKLREGKSTMEIEVKSNDEIGYLADSFNKMSVGIQDRNELLNSLLRTFEGKFGKIARILVRQNIQKLIKKNPRIGKILPKSFGMSASKDKIRY
jgi:methyl-accepting chemotaxis protein